jgi:hypothetical protein
LGWNSAETRGASFNTSFANNGVSILDLLMLAIEEGIDPSTFRQMVAKAWAAQWLLRPCGLLLNHPLAQDSPPLKDVFLETLALDLEALDFLRDQPWARAGMLRQLAPSCVCCAQQGQLGLVLAGMYRALKALGATRSGDSLSADDIEVSACGTVARTMSADLAVLLVSTPQISPGKLARGLRYLKPPVRLVPIEGIAQAH